MTEVVRCLVCARRVKISVPECRCKALLCGAHVAPEAHACSFDYRAHAREMLARQNPKVVPPKLSPVRG